MTLVELLRFELFGLQMSGTLRGVPDSSTAWVAGTFGRVLNHTVMSRTT